MLTSTKLPPSHPENSIEPVAASFRDPSGFVFQEDGVFYRRIALSYQSEYRRLMDSGLYEKLVSANLLLPHEEVASDRIRPEQLSFVSYPYEWSFTAWKEAAHVTLQIQTIAMEYGMSLKDASAFNIQFVRGKPVLIDTLSFETYREGEPWIGYRQFCEHFLAPLALMAYRDIRLGELMRLHLDGIPLELTANLLPWRTRLRLPLLAHIYVQANFQKRGGTTSPTGTASSAQTLSRMGMLAVIENLQSAVGSCQWEPSGTVWGDYYSDTNYTASAMTAKEELVATFLETMSPLQNLWDFGANDARFSRLSSERGIPTIAFDMDPAAVEKAYRDVRKRDDPHLLPLRLDLMNPSPDLGWAQTERMSLLSRGPADGGMALALIHHLAIGNNVPLTRIANFFAEVVQRWLIVEFVPKEDSQTQRLLKDRRDIFTDYHQAGFEAAFARYGEIVRREAIPQTQRILYLFRRHGK